MGTDHVLLHKGSIVQTRRRLKRVLPLFVFFIVTAMLSHSAAANNDYVALSKAILIGTDAERKAAADAFIARGGDDMIPSLVLLMRIGGSHVVTQRVLEALTGEKLRTWREAMLYQEAHPEIKPHPSYYDLKLWYWGGIDEDFLSLFNSPPDRQTMRIRFEEITWGGALYDGIPSLDNPSMIAAQEADYLLDTDLVFGVEINGDVRAYPLRIMGWHEMFNDVIGGVPVALAYCTLCGAGILFETQTKHRPEPFVFGSSGLLYRSNKLMFDRQTNSLWNHFTGEPVSGSLAQSGIKLKTRPTTITSWAQWRDKHPDTQVLSLNTGHFRDYDSGVVYREYFASPDLMFPTITDQTRLLQKQHIYGIRTAGGAKAWPLDAFATEPVINDRVGFFNVVLIGNDTTQTVRAYQRDDYSFSGNHASVKGPGGTWQITESALVGPKGEKLPRVAGHIAYWFAWDGYLGAKSQLYQRDKSK